MGVVRLYVGEYYVQIETPEFIVRQPEREITVRFNPARHETPTGLDSLGRLFGMVVVQAEASDDGSLTIGFVGGFGIAVPAGSEYEPWAIRGPIGTLVSLPSGGLASFPLP